MEGGCGVGRRPPRRYCRVRYLYCTSLAVLRDLHAEHASTQRPACSSRAPKKKKATTTKAPQAPQAPQGTGQAHGKAPQRGRTGRPWEDGCSLFFSKGPDAEEGSVTQHRHRHRHSTGTAQPEHDGEKRQRQQQHQQRRRRHAKLQGFTHHAARMTEATGARTGRMICTYLQYCTSSMRPAPRPSHAPSRVCAPPSSTPWHRRSRAPRGIYVRSVIDGGGEDRPVAPNGSKLRPTAFPSDLVRRDSFGDGGSRVGTGVVGGMCDFACKRAGRHRACKVRGTSGRRDGGAMRALLAVCSTSGAVFRPKVLYLTTTPLLHTYSRRVLSVRGHRRTDPPATAPPLHEHSIPHATRVLSTTSLRRPRLTFAKASLGS